MSRFKEFLNEMTVAEDKQVETILGALEDHLSRMSRGKIEITNVHDQGNGFAFDAKVEGGILFTFAVDMVKKH